MTERIKRKLKIKKKKKKKKKKKRKKKREKEEKKLNRMKLIVNYEKRRGGKGKRKER